MITKVKYKKFKELRSAVKVPVSLNSGEEAGIKIRKISSKVRLKMISIGPRLWCRIIIVNNPLEMVKIEIQRGIFNSVYSIFTWRLGGIIIVLTASVAKRVIVVFSGVNVLILEWEMIALGANQIIFCIFLDKIALLFIFTVFLITRRVLLFRISYIAEEVFYTRFYLLIGVFVFSILLLVISPNIVRLLLGWDGLGIRSYLLVIYYGRNKAYNSGIVTAITNRFGDALLLIAVGLVVSYGSWNIIFYKGLNSSLILAVFLVVVGAFTKRAQIPFSSWLPAAIAAPTPVSSLVHSSTLVTAGVYLLIRHGAWLRYDRVLSYILIRGALTMTIARIRACAEEDLKKVVALSTLRQLGVMIIAIGSGIIILSFFHLLGHAFFKALLFICTGNLIHRGESYQDTRVYGNLGGRIVLSSRALFTANLGLCGLPFITAFYSKEAILEHLVAFRGALYVTVLIFIGVGLTLAYSFRFIRIALIQGSSQVPQSWRCEEDYALFYSIFCLFPLGLAGGRVLRWRLIISSESLYTPLIIKGLVWGCLASGVLLGMVISFKSIASKKRGLGYYFIIWGLPAITTSVPSWIRGVTGGLLRKPVDQGWSEYFFSEAAQSSAKERVRLLLNLVPYILMLKLSFIWIIIFLILIRL